MPLLRRSPAADGTTLLAGLHLGRLLEWHFCVLQHIKLNSAE